MRLPDAEAVEDFIGAEVYLACCIYEDVYVVDVETRDAAERAALYLRALLPVRESFFRQIKLWHDDKPKDEGIRLTLVLDMDQLRERSNRH